jgi:ribosomal protein S18 acetylase RimI-like enzyme
VARATWSIERGARADLGAIGAMLGRAFAENPVARACLDRSSTAARLAQVTRLNTGLARAALRRGEVDVVRDGSAIAGAMLTFPPGRWPLDLRAWMSMAWGALGTGRRGVERYALYDDHVGTLHPKGPCTYLWVLGVEPSMQGRGIGGALLGELAGRSDRAGMPTYLETDKESSVAMYRSHGFEVEREVTIAKLGGLRTWTMLRHPR